MTAETPDSSVIIHLTRFYGAYANRIRKALFEDASPDLSSSPSSSPPPSEPDPASAGAPASRPCWARLIRKVFEVDPPHWTRWWPSHQRLAGGYVQLAQRQGPEVPLQLDLPDPFLAA